MRSRITTLREERASVWEQMKALSDTASAASRDLTTEEYVSYNAMEADLRSKGAEVIRLENEAGISASMTRTVDRDTEREDYEARGAPQSAVVRPNATPEYRAAFARYMAGDVEARAALQVGTDSEGGYTVADTFLTTLLESMREFGVIANLATHYRTSTNGQVKVPTVATYGTAALTAEEAAFTQSEDTFGEITMDAFKYGRMVKISDELVTDSAFDIMGKVAELAGLSLAIATGTAYATGVGTTDPRGLFVAAANGKTAASATAITADELIDLYHSVLSPYRKRSTWIMKDSTAVLVRKLKSSDNQYLWQPGLQAGQPDVLFGRPVEIDPNAPAATTGLKSVLFGDVSKYWIRDVEGTTVKVLDQLYAATGQIGFRIHIRTDGDLTDANAVKVLTQA